MNLKKSLIAIWIMTISFSSYSQTKFSFGPEIGVNGSSFNYYSPGIALRNYVKIMNKPVLSPIGGVWAKLHFPGKYFVDFGVQYFQFGNKSFHHYSGSVYANPPSTYIIDSWGHLKFQKISIPLAFGRDIKIKKMKASVFCGLRKSYLTKANYYYKEHRVKTINNKTEEIDKEFTENLLDTKMYGSLKRAYAGLFIGFGLNITKRINMNMSMAIDNDIDLSPKYTCFSSNYINHDFALSVKYNLNKNL